MNLENQLFDKFTRGDKESAKAGVGLGLSICKTIIEAHHGKIWAQNKMATVANHANKNQANTDQETKNKVTGAMFTFSLPLGSPPSIPPEDEGL